jgi:hypothetical protein
MAAVPITTPGSRRCDRLADVVVVFCLVFFAGAGSVSGQTVPIPLTPEAIGAQIREYAARFGAPDTPEYSAALRRALASAAVSLRDDKGRLDSNRTVDVSTPPPGTGTQVVEVDHDPRYSNWLNAMADHPIAALNIEGCQSMEVRVVGGETIRNPHCFPEVSLMFASASKDFCSGILVNNQHTILTAGHCLCLGAIEYVVFGQDMRDVKLYRIAAVSQKGHDGIKCPGGSTSESDFLKSLAGRDIAVVKLATDVPADVARFTPLPQSSEARTLFAGGNKNLLTVGFGFTELVPGRPDLLQNPKKKTLALTGILSPDCSDTRAGRTDSEIYGCQAGQEILAVDGRPVGPCYGDSGGGGYMLVDQPGSANKLATLVGVTSRLVSADCGDGAIYTSLTPEILSWINDAIKNDH